MRSLKLWSRWFNQDCNAYVEGPDPMDVDTWGEKLIVFDLSRRG